MGINKEALTIEISRKKRTTLLLSLALILFFVLSVFVWIKFLYQKSFPDGTLEFVLFIGLPFFVIGGVFSIKKMFDDKPALILSSVGISNYSNAITSDLIEWKDVINFETDNVKGVTLIIIKVNDPDRYIRESSGAKRILMRMGKWYYGSPFSITTAVLECTKEDLIVALNYKLSKYKSPR